MGEQTNEQQNPKNSLWWLIGTVMISTVVATIAVLSFFDQRMSKKFDEKHKEAEHIIPSSPIPDTRLTGVEVISETVNGKGNLEARCTCPRSKLAIGGGAEILNSGDNSFLQVSKPILASDGKPVGWEAKEHRQTGDFDHSIKVYAICVPFKK